MKWYLIDDAIHARCQIFEHELKAQTKEEAIAEAKAEWNCLTTREQKDRDEFYIGYADVDEDGCVDYDSMTDIYSIK